MLPMCSDAVRARVIPILEKIGLPTVYSGDPDKALGYVIHDKKCEDGALSVILVEKVGEFIIKKMTVAEFSQRIKNYNGVKI
jgi:3-dehydroquinate synthase